MTRFYPQQLSTLHNFIGARILLRNEECWLVSSPYHNPYTCLPALLWTGGCAEQQTTHYVTIMAVVVVCNAIKTVAVANRVVIAGGVACALKNDCPHRPSIHPSIHQPAISQFTTKCARYWPAPCSMYLIMTALNLLANMYLRYYLPSSSFTWWVD